MPTPENPPKLLDQVQAVLRMKHYSIRTERVYLGWIKRYILFHHKTHPAQMGAPEVEAFLSHLAVAGKVAASTQNQAKSALLFLYREVLALELPWLDNVTQAKTPLRLPVVYGLMASIESGAVSVLQITRRLAPPIMLLQRPLHVLAHQR